MLPFRPGFLGCGVVLEDLPRHRADPVGRDDVARERLARELPVAERHARQRVVDRDVGRVVGEVAVAQLVGRHPAVAAGVEARADVGDVLEAEHEERLVPAAVEARDADRAAEGEARPVRRALDDVLAAGLAEEVVGAELVRLREVVRRAMEGVGPGLDADAGDAALRVAELRVERRGLHLELLHEVGRRHVGRDDLVGVGGGGARGAVDQQVAAVAARALVGVADDVRRLVRAIQTLAAGVRQAGRQPHDLVGVTVDQWQRRDARLIDHQPEVGVGRVDGRRRGRDGERLFHRADLEHDLHVDGLGHRHDDVVLDVLLEPLEFDGDRGTCPEAGRAPGTGPARWWSPVRPSRGRGP